MKKSKFSFSIVTPSFNQGEFLSQTIKSVLGQKYNDVSYWVMDGGSTDTSVSVLQSFGKKIRWESKKDKGQSDAINKGIKKDLGDVFAYINSDDYYLPQAFQRVAAVFSENPKIMWVVGDVLIVDTKGNEIQSFVRWYKRLWRSFYRPNVLSILNPLPQPAVFLRSEVVKKIGPFSQKLHFTMDYEYWIKVQNEFGPPYCIDSKLAAFRIHSGSKGGSMYVRQFEEEIKVARRYFRSSVLLMLHRIHNQCILLAYSIIK